MAEATPDQPPRLDDTAVRGQLGRVDELLGRLEEMPGPVPELALAAVSALAVVYGEALARVADHADEVPELREALVSDELLGHLLVLHGLHPEPVRDRVDRALEGLRPELAARGVSTAVERIEDGRAVLRITGGGSGCGSAAADADEAVRAAVLAVAPELSEVRIGRESEPTFLPLSALASRADGAPDGTAGGPDGSSGRVSPRPPGTPGTSGRGPGGATGGTSDGAGAPS